MSEAIKDPLRGMEVRSFHGRGEEDTLNLKVVSMTLGVWTAFTFVLCVAYGLAVPESLHMYAFLEQVLPGFKWLSWSAFALGLAESFLYGVYAGLLYVPVYNFLQRRWG